MKKLCALLAALLLALPVAAMAETAVASFYPVYLLALNLTQGIEGVELTSLAGADAGLLATLAWSLAMGTDIGGCATPIGASANVVGTSVAAKNGHIITWGKYCKQAVPATVIVLIISTAVILLRYCI